MKNTFISCFLLIGLVVGCRTQLERDIDRVTPKAPKRRPLTTQQQPIPPVPAEIPVLLSWDAVEGSIGVYNIYHNSTLEDFNAWGKISTVSADQTGSTFISPPGFYSVLARTTQGIESGKAYIGWDNSYTDGEVDYFLIHVDEDPITNDNFGDSLLTLRTDDKLVTTSTNYYFPVFNIPPGPKYFGIRAVNFFSQTSSISENLFGVVPEYPKNVTIELLD